MPYFLHVHAIAAEFILQHKPRAVVVETALTPEHGAWPGNTVSCRDRVVEGPGAFFLRMCCQVGLARVCSLRSRAGGHCS